MRILFLATGAAALWLLGCGDGSTSSASSASTGPGGAGGAPSTASASSSGEGGAGGLSGLTASASSSGAGGAEPCNDGFVDIDGDGPTKHQTSPCIGSWAIDPGRATSAAGYAGYLGKGGKYHTYIEGCSDPGPTGLPIFRFNVELQGVGTAPTGTAFYAVSGAETYSTGTDLTVNITAYDPTGGHITGDFKTTVSGAAPNPPKVLSGHFKVCHVMDQPKPP